MINFIYFYLLRSKQVEIGYILYLKLNEVEIFLRSNEKSRDYLVILRDTWVKRVTDDNKISSCLIRLLFFKLYEKFFSCEGIKYYIIKMKILLLL